MRAIYLPVFSFLSFCLLATCNTFEPQNLRITLLHTNDVHSRLSQIDANDQLCDDEAMLKGNCFGGLARRFTKVREIRERYPNVLLLDGGDEFQGTLFFAKYHGEEAQYFMNLLGYQAMAVGNHEFDDGPEVLGRFAQKINFPLLSANIDASLDPALRNLIKPYAIVNVGGHRIGIVGFTTEETMTISSPGRLVRFLPIEESVQRAVDELNRQGVKYVFAVSHSGFERDREVASRVRGISVIVSGHTNTLLSNVDKNAEGPYPTVVSSANGEPVLIVSAYAYGKYLGFLEVEFDPNGRLAKWRGEPILLDASVEEDAKIAQEVLQWRQPLEEMRREVVAELPEPLNGSLLKCRHHECSLGNAVADGIFLAAKRYGAQAAMMNSGGIRTSLNRGKVTRWNIKDALPFGNSISIVELTGQEIQEILEYSVSGNIDGRTDGTAKFLQVSQMRYVWNSGGKSGHQISQAQIRDAKGRYEPIDLHQTYRIATNSFVVNGGDGYGSFFEDTKHTQNLSETIDEALIAYLASDSHLDDNAARIIRVQ